MSEWQPIDTAPESEYVMVWLQNYGWVRAIASRSPHMPTVLEWWAPDMDGGNGTVVYNPTHWFRLPWAPK